MLSERTYCDVPDSPCPSKTGPVAGPSFSIFGRLGSPVGVRFRPPVNPGPCLVAAWSQGGLLETPPRWRVTISTHAHFNVYTLRSKSLTWNIYTFSSGCNVLTFYVLYVYIHANSEWLTIKSNDS